MQGWAGAAGAPSAGACRLRSILAAASAAASGWRLAAGATVTRGFDSAFPVTSCAEHSAVTSYLGVVKGAFLYFGLAFRHGGPSTSSARFWSAAISTRACAYLLTS